MIESYTFPNENEWRRNVHFGIFISFEWSKLGRVLSNNMCNHATTGKVTFIEKRLINEYHSKLPKLSPPSSPLTLKYCRLTLLKVAEVPHVCSSRYRRECGSNFKSYQTFICKMVKLMKHLIAKESTCTCIHELFQVSFANSLLMNLFHRICNIYLCSKAWNLVSLIITGCTCIKFTA
jgi:hypothetical protein